MTQSLPTSAPAPLTPEQIQTLLDHTDWSAYWQEVSVRVTEGVEQYRRASLRSLEGGGSYGASSTIPPAPACRSQST